MNILILGSGGREHALAWAIRQNPKCDRLFVAPGNIGMAPLAELAALDILSGAAVVEFCAENAIDLVVIGPEAPLAAGVADDLREAGILVFGPSAAAARLEASKSFTKEICDACAAPTAAWARFDAAEPARAHIGKTGAPIVIKADGLAAGKGVTVAMTEEEAIAAIDEAFGGAFGDAGAEVVKLFDSWAGSLKGQDFDDFALTPATRIISALKARHPDVPVIAFPREAGPRYQGFARAVGADCVALDNSVDAEWAAAHVQTDGCVQGNLDPRLLVTGGPALQAETRRVVQAFRGGPHIFNLGHGITPDADPDNVSRMLEAIRG